jgi:hypothetical protein
LKSAIVSRRPLDPAPAYFVRALPIQPVDHRLIHQQTIHEIERFVARRAAVGNSVTKPVAGIHRLVPGDGFEPPTNGLQNRCSTTELTRRLSDECGASRLPREH